MPTNPPPCYRCGMRPSMLPIAYCAECYQLTGVARMGAGCVGVARVPCERALFAALDALTRVH